MSSWWDMVTCRQTWCWRGSCILHRQQEVISLIGYSMSICETSKPASAMTHFLQQDHIYSKKATFPNTATPFGGHFLSNYLEDGCYTTDSNGILASCDDIPFNNFYTLWIIISWVEHLGKVWGLVQSHRTVAGKEL